MARFLFFLFLLASAAPPLVAAQQNLPQPRKEILSLLDKGIEAHEAYRYADALRLFHKALAK